MQLRLVISDLQGLQKDGNKVVSFRNSKLTQLMEPYLVGHSHTCIMIAVSNNPENHDDTKRSLDFASTAQQIQMGIDRHGKIMKSSSKVNHSRVPPPVEEIEETVHEPISDPYGVGTDFSDWTKQDVIDDLVYYMQCYKNLHEGIQRMKVEWQKDEQEWNEYKVSYEDRISDLKICLHNARATGTNDLIDAEERHSKKVKKLLSAIEELKNKDAEADSRRLQESELRSKIADLQEELEAERGPSPLSPISESTHVFELNSTRQLFQNEKASDKVAELEIENRQLVEDNDALNNQIKMGKEMLKMLREEKSELQNALEQAKNPDPDVEGKSKNLIKPIKKT
jgi:kinesin family protein 20